MIIPWVNVKLLEFYASNFRSIGNIRLGNIGNTNIILGYNGYGKSNLLTSIYTFIRNLNAGIERKGIEDTRQEYILLWYGYDSSKPIKLGGKIYFDENDSERVLGRKEKFVIEIANNVSYKNGYIEWSLDTLLINNSPPTRESLEDTKKLLSYASSKVEYVPIFDQTYFEELLKAMNSFSNSPINLKKKWYEFSNLISSIVPEIKGIEFWDSRRLVLNVYNLPIYIDLAASGFQRVILLLFTVWLSNGKILLLEEPEVNMHPILQVKIMKLLREWASNNFIQIFISTHSPYIIKHADNFIILRREKESTNAIEVPVTAELKTLMAALNVNLDELLFSKIIMLVNDLVEPNAILNWLERIGISPEENGIKAYKIQSDYELLNWLKLRDKLGFNLIFVGLCDKLGMNDKELCVPFNRDLESYYNKNELLEVLKSLGVYPDEKELKELYRDDTYRWLSNVLKKRGLEFEKMRSTLSTLVTARDTLEVPKEIEILANKIKALAQI